MINKRKKIITILALVIIAVFAVAVLAVTLISQRNDAEMKSEAILKINSLQQERMELYSKISLLENDKGETEIGGAAVFLCFDNADRNLYEIIFPTVTYHGFRAIFSFRPGTAPSDEGIITVEQYNELIAADWQAAVKYSEDADYNKMKERFAALGVPFPNIMVFDDGDYSSSLTAELKALGIDICICNTDEQDEMTKIPSEPIMYNPSVVKLRTNKAINEGTPLVVRTGRVKRYVDNRKTDCDLEKYEEMLRWLKIMQNKHKLRLQNTYDKSSVSDILSESTEKAVQNKAEIERLNQQIAEIDKEIEKLKQASE